MPRQKTTGRDRIDMKIRPDITDMVMEAAAKRLITFTDYIRDAIAAALKRDGFTILAEPRPRRRKKAG